MPRCDWWPDCPCKEQWDFYNDLLDGDWEPTLEAWEQVKRKMYYMLECVAHTCPDRKYRRKAAAQLRERLFVEARWEDVERVAQAKREKLTVHVNPDS